MATTSTAAAKPGFVETLRALSQPHVFVMLLLGFSSGLPFLLSFGTLSAWLATAGVDYKTIGLMSLANFAYSFKFLWAPAVDNVPLPVLSRLLGRRRAWMLLAQAGVAASLLAMSQCDPRAGVATLALFAVCLAFSSATQDIAIDAWRIEVAPVEQQPLMAAVTTLGYRLGLLTAGAGALALSTRPSWEVAYATMAACMLVGAAGAALARRTPEPEGAVAGDETVAELAKAAGLGGRGVEAAGWAYRAIVAPFVDFFARHGVGTAVLILALIGFYSIADRVMGVMANPFYIALGFTTDQIAVVSKTYGVWISIAGAIVGGLAAVRLGPRWTLVAGVVLGAASNLAFAWLATRGPDMTAFFVAITLENALSGFSGVAIIAYLSSLTNVKFSGTQYALFTSFAALPGKFAGAGSGYMIDALGGFYPFFIATALLGLPALALALAVIALDRRREARETAARAVPTPPEPVRA